MPRFSLMSMFSVAAFALASFAQANEPAKPAVYQGDAANLFTQMKNINLTDAEIRAVADYIAGLH